MNRQLKAQDSMSAFDEIIKNTYDYKNLSMILEEQRVSLKIYGLKDHEIEKYQNTRLTKQNLLDEYVFCNKLYSPQSNGSLRFIQFSVVPLKDIN